MSNLLSVCDGIARSSLADAIPTPQTIWVSWNLDPVLLLVLVLAIVLYARGFVRVQAWHRYRQDVLWGEAVAYFAGIVTLVFVFISPLDRLSTAVLWGHMVQYMVLTVLSSVLLIAARPTRILVRGLPLSWSRSLRHWARHATAARIARTILANPYVIAGVDIGTLIFWHVPVLYQAAVRYEALHVLELASFLASGLLFWWAVRNPTAGPAMSYGRVLGCFVVTSLISLGVGLTLFSANTVLYPIYLGRTALWGVSPRGDQQIAGVMLGVTPELFDVLTFIVILARWVQSEGTAPYPDMP